MVKIYVQTPLKFWFHIKFSREYDYVNEYPYSAKLQNMTGWTESGTQSSHIKGLDKCVWCWVCSVLSKQRGEVVWWGGGVRFTKANCGQESQWLYTDCGPAVTGMFASCHNLKWLIHSNIMMPCAITHKFTKAQINGLMQERCNSIANALDLCLLCINHSKCFQIGISQTKLYYPPPQPYNTWY